MDKNNQAQHLKREILVRTIEAFLSDNYPENTRLIAYDMRPQGCEVPYRCCIHKERDVIQHRIIANLGLSMEEIDERKLLSDYAKKALERTEPDPHSPGSGTLLRRTRNRRVSSRPAGGSR